MPLNFIPAGNYYYRLVFTMKTENTLIEYSRELKRFFLSRVKNPADADDLVQTVFQKTLTHFTEIREAEKFRPWLYAVARNALTDHYRKSGRYIQKDSIELPEQSEGPSETYKELSRCIKPFLKQLPVSYRTALIKVDLHNRPQTEVAKEEGLSYSGLKSRIQRGRRLLRHLFSTCCDYKLDARGGVVYFQSKIKSCSCT